ncbi:MAG: hypothetical protein COB71_11435 [Thiotrichales bacterium]|nr:MAG: hypothetical protein COB71_11435 [Thiotrichales bacterium]
MTEGSLSSAFTGNNGSSVGVINGGDGRDVFTLFGSVQTLNAGGGNDVITLNSGGSVLTLNAGDGNDTITTNAGASAGIVNGDDGEDRFLIRANLLNAIFNGGAGNDYFSVEEPASSALYIANVQLNGDGGSDSFDVGALTTSIDQASTLTIAGGEDADGMDRDSLGSTVVGFELTLGDSGLVAGVTATEIEVVSAIDGILNARNGTTTTWNINGVNAGRISDIGTGGSNDPESLTFSGFVTLNGGDGVDVFNVSGNGSLVGSDDFVVAKITGGGGQNELHINLDGRTQSGQINYNGDVNNDEITLIGTVGVDTETFTPDVNASADDQLAYGMNGVTFNVTYSEVKTVTSHVVAKHLTINNSGAADDTVTLGEGFFSTNTSQANVNYSVSDKTNITVRARGLRSDLDVASAMTITGDMTIKADAINDVRIMPTAPLISANHLILDGVKQAGSASNGLTTDIRELSVINHSGEIFIVEQDGIELIDISNSSGVIDVTTVAGSISSTANLQTRGALNLNAAADITLTGNNELSGALTLNGTTVTVNNRLDTDLASVTADDLTITSLGGIIGSGAIVVTNGSSTGLARFTSSTGSILLNNANNNFDVVTLQAANDASLVESNNMTIRETAVGGALNVSSNGNMRVGELTAQTMTLHSESGAIVDASSRLTASTVTLSAARGIGGGTVSHVNGNEGFGNLDTSGAINTQTATLSAINTTTGTVNISNRGDLNVRDLRNRGDIILRNSGEISLQVTQNGSTSLGAIDANYGGNISSPVYAGSVVILNESEHSVRTTGFGLSEADIIAESLFVNSVTDFGEQGQPIRLRVNDQFTLIGSRGSVISIGGEPRHTTTSADLIEGDATSGLSGQQRVDIGSLANIDPAIFAEVRNYNYGDTSLLLPSDQITSGEEEDEEEDGIAGDV